MKKLLFLAAGLLICHLVSAQQSDYPDHTKQLALKFAPASIMAGKLSLGGEYNIKHRNSITIMAGIPFNKNQMIEYDGNKSDVETRAVSLMAGFRHYLGKKTMSGFYIEPYVKYLEHDAKGLIHSNLGGQQVIFDSYSDYKGIGVGAQLGVQFIIAKAVVLDLFLVGPEANSAKFSSGFTDITNNAAWDFADASEAEQEIADVLKDIPVVGDKIDIKVDTEKRNVSAAFSGFVPGFRIGGSVGIRF